MCGRWQQMLSGLPEGMRVSWIVERREAAFDMPPETSDIAGLAQRKRHAFLEGRVQGGAHREREAEESFVAARRAHPAIESAINGLEHRGLDRVRSHGADGFARTVALSVFAANLHRIGLILQKRERKRQQRVA